MVELIATSPLDGMDALTIGSVTLREVDLGAMTSIAPFKGAMQAASEAMQTAHGVPFPKAGRIERSGEVRAIWVGRDAAMLVGAKPGDTLRKHAALTDQSDAWAAVTLSGAAAEEVLARLVPLDLRLQHFGEACAARSLLGHMNAVIARSAPDTFFLLVFRSMAGTLLHDLKSAMESVASRG